MNEEDYLISLETLTKVGEKVDLTRLQKEPEAIAEQDLLQFLSSRRRRDKNPRKSA